jgi:hypothetical protein
MSIASAGTPKTKAGKNQLGIHSVPKNEIAKMATNAAEKQIAINSFKSNQPS